MNHLFWALTWLDSFKFAQATTSGETGEVVTEEVVESQEDYDKRMAINAKMRFHRSLASC